MTRLKGTPELVIEDLYLDKKYDLEIRKENYQQFGVKEYFKVNPFSKEVFGFYLSGKEYTEHTIKIGKLQSKLSKKYFHFNPKIYPLTEALATSKSLAYQTIYIGY